MKKAFASPELRARIKAIAEAPLPLDEWRARMAVPIAPEEMDEMRALIRWFCRRYATPEARLAYARKAYLRWTR